jgi:hypothetical protein
MGRCERVPFDLATCIPPMSNMSIYLSNITLIRPPPNTLPQPSRAPTLPHPPSPHPPPRTWGWVAGVGYGGVVGVPGYVSLYIYICMAQDLEPPAPPRQWSRSPPFPPVGVGGLVWVKGCDFSDPSELHLLPNRAEQTEISDSGLSTFWFWST